jgi:hypothetical protein
MNVNENKKRKRQETERIVAKNQDIAMIPKLPEHSIRIEILNKEVARIYLWNSKNQQEVSFSNSSWQLRYATSSSTTSTTFGNIPLSFNSCFLIVHNLSYDLLFNDALILKIRAQNSQILEPTSPPIATNNQSTNQYTITNYEDDNR